MIQAGPFTVGQKPAQPLLISITDPITNDAIDLTGYSGVELLLVDPNGDVIDTGQGSAFVADPAQGIVSYEFPENETLFEKAGDYMWQLQLNTATAQDYTAPAVFEVTPKVGS